MKGKRALRVCGELQHVEGEEAMYLWKEKDDKDEGDTKHKEHWVGRADIRVDESRLRGKKGRGGKKKRRVEKMSASASAVSVYVSHKHKHT